MSHARGWDHTPYQAMAAAALAAGLLPAAMAASVPAPALLAGAWFGYGVASYVWAAGGALVAAITFSAGEAQRPGWLCLAASYLVLVPTRILVGPAGGGLLVLPERWPALLLGGNVASGLLAVAGFLLLTRAWRDSGLDASTPASRLALRLLALAAAVALAGPDLAARLPAAGGGDLGALGDVVTDLLDGALLVVAAPVLRAALALGGGLVAWPWVFLTASLLAWLGYDAMGALGGTVGLDPRAVRVGEETCRALAAAYAFAAGLSQRWVMTELHRRR